MPSINSVGATACSLKLVRRCNCKGKMLQFACKELYVSCMCRLDEDGDKDFILYNVVYELSKRIVARKMLQFSMFEWWRNF